MELKQFCINYMCLALISFLIFISSDLVFTHILNFSKETTAIISIMNMWAFFILSTIIFMKESK